MKPRGLVFFIILSACIINTCYAQPQNNTTVISVPGPALGVAWGFSYGDGNPPAIFMPQLRNMNVHLSKVYLFWQQLAPAKGQYHWNAVDTLLLQLAPQDELLVSVFSSSLWATKTASTTLPPSPAKSADDYYQFIFELVKHCKGKIKYWENDSEANNPIYWAGTPDEFINQLKTFYRAVKAADPAAMVVMGGYDGLFNPPPQPPFPGQQYGLSFFSKAIKEAAASFDLFDIRLYRDPYSIPARVQYFRQLLADSGHHQPIICTEYNGPGFFGFPANRKYIGQVAEWQRAIVARDTAAYLKIKNPIAALYDSMSSLPAQTQMFMMGSPQALTDKYDRMQCRDIVMRNILAFSAGVQKTMYWDLWHNTEEKNDLMTLMYGKNKLLDYENGQLSKAHPEAAVFKKMAGLLAGIKTVRRLDLPEQPLLYFFEITRAGKSNLYIAWENRDAFAGEDQPATHYLLPFTGTAAKATELFGHAVPAAIANGNLAIDLSLTPVFIEGRK